MRAVLFLSISVVALLAGCAGAPDTPARSIDLARTWTLAPGDFAEVNLHLEAGEGVDATFEASDIVGWDVHSHTDDRRVIVHDNGTAANGTIRFVAEQPGAYSLLWQVPHTGGVVELHVVVLGEGAVRSVVP